MVGIGSGVAESRPSPIFVTGRCIRDELLLLLRAAQSSSLPVFQSATAHITTMRVGERGVAGEY